MPSFTSRPSIIAGATVLISGVARSMGALYARKAAREGAAAIALWDADGDTIEMIAKQLRQDGFRAHAFAVDVSRCSDVVLGAERMRAELGAPDIVINNSGIVHGVPRLEGDPSRDIELTMRQGVLTPMWLTRELLPEMMCDRTRDKRILNIASCGASNPDCPRSRAYDSSTQAMIGWSESLRLELARGEHTHMAVTTFCPSEVCPSRNTSGNLHSTLTIERAADAAWQGMLAGLPFVTKPWTVRVAAAARSVLPESAWSWLADQTFHLYSSQERMTASAAG